MIANLMTALLLALGVGTSNLNNESIDSFKQAEKPIQEAVTTETIDINCAFDLIDTTEQTEGDLYKKVDKYYIWKNGQQNMNYWTSYLSINNTTYTLKLNEKTYNGRYNNESANYTLLQINNYYDSQITIDLHMRYDNTGGYTYDCLYRVYDTQTEMNQYLNMTLNNTTYYTIESYINSIPYTEIIKEQNEGVSTSSPQIISRTTNTITLQAHETKNIILMLKLSRMNATTPVNSLQSEPYALYIDGIASVPQITQEIVDVPNLMFTILTLPFSFYSTAFNLTIFPNTPYQINFGNIILTILAALILMYLIKKVLK